MSKRAKIIIAVVLFFWACDLFKAQIYANNANMWAYHERVHRYIESP
jgi:hypothetical protein